jgi:ABC-2 type transport system permease protein
LPFDPAALPVLFLQPALFSVLTGFAGIGMNVLFPRLDWNSEIQVIKQSVSVLLSMLAGVAFAALPVLVYIGLLNGAMDLSLFAYLWMGVELLFILGIRAWLTHGGARRLDRLAA